MNFSQNSPQGLKPILNADQSSYLTLISDRTLRGHLQPCTAHRFSPTIGSLRNVQSLLFPSLCFIWIHQIYLILQRLSRISLC